VYVVLAIVLVADQCHGLLRLHYKSRENWQAAPIRGTLRPFKKPADVIYVSPTDTEECNIDTCPKRVQEIQKRDLDNSLQDIGYK
jgi:hypothetical protein